MSERETSPSEEEEDDAPLAIIGTVRDLAKWMPPGIAETFGARPVWFILEMDAELVTVFEQIPEDPMPKGKVEAILTGLRTFANERNTELQTVLGPTDGLSFGFHVDASLDRVIEAFEEDGFEVIEALAEGEVAFGEEEASEA
ncbi:MAG: hypothetical protein JNL21_24830 [Myxococcales bacterium]|nr:hypothetical protein [Myxococcales bacterium]